MQPHVSDYAEPLIKLQQQVRILSDLLNDRKYEEAVSVALEATVQVYHVYDWAKSKVPR